MTQPIDFAKLNSLTKYPSILTYHQLGQKGRLTEERIESSIFQDDDTIHCYEKIDGENSRIVFLCNGTDIDYAIGSREDLLFAKGDRMKNPTGNIAAYFEPIAEQIAENLQGLHGLVVVYFESYGAKHTPKRQQYTSDNTQFGRLFDVFALKPDELDNLLDLSVSEIAAWRDNGGQPYFTCARRENFAKIHDLPTAPLLFSLTGAELPVTVQDTHTWLQQFKHTRVGINASGLSEGIIVRTKDRSTIAKIRMTNYVKTVQA